VDNDLNTARLYLELKGVFGTGFANFFSSVDKEGVRRILGETIAHTVGLLCFFRFLFRGSPKSSML
jgi:hypothetical protein